jgi:hypothetical protein
MWHSAWMKCMGCVRPAVHIFHWQECPCWSCGWRPDVYKPTSSPCSIFVSVMMLVFCWMEACGSLWTQIMNGSNSIVKSLLGPKLSVCLPACLSVPLYALRLCAYYVYNNNSSNNNNTVIRIIIIIIINIYIYIHSCVYIIVYNIYIYIIHVYIVFDLNSFIRKRPFLAKYHFTFAKLSRTTCLSCAWPM